MCGCLVLRNTTDREYVRIQQLRTLEKVGRKSSILLRFGLLTKRLLLTDGVGRRLLRAFR